MGPLWYRSWLHRWGGPMRIHDVPMNQETTVQKDFLGRGWRFPFGFDPASGAVAMASYEDDIRQALTIILGTRPGERQMMPTFGCRVHEVLYTPNSQANATLVAYHVRSALERWEPRVEVLDVTASPSPEGRMDVGVRYRIRATLAEQQLHVGLTTGG